MTGLVLLRKDRITEETEKTFLKNDKSNKNIIFFTPELSHSIFLFHKCFRKIRKMKEKEINTGDDLILEVGSVSHRARSSGYNAYRQLWIWPNGYKDNLC